MLLDTIQDNNQYLRSTLVQVLAEIKQSKKHTDQKVVMASCGKTIFRRERAGVKVYLAASRDPRNGWRIYTGKQIKDIVRYELGRKKSK